MADEEQEGGAESPKKSSGKSLIIVIVLLLLMLLGGGAFAAWYFMAAKPEMAETPEVVKPEVPKFVTLEPFVISLQTQGRPRYMQIKLTLMSRDEGAVEVLKTYVPLIRNAIVNYLSQMTYKEATAKEATDQIRHNTIERINELLTAELAAVALEDLLITDLVVQ
ncbi:flagellar basal body-associated FliL family protein [Endozoicomonas arenosclerae]|uniref:flagellar basal body-associated FliL family protein n=1 Tax=Endozoicomonas arenosclerae TaxID=1633495 RepID=UPI0007819B5E|nr:flagellar basal body-associated FliL family protein [Endozoicomonas arenosclerae]